MAVGVGVVVVVVIIIVVVGCLTLRRFMGGQDTP